MSAKTRNLVLFAMLILGIGSIAVGLVLGGAHDVMSKAVRICLECIGIG